MPSASEVPTAPHPEGPAAGSGDVVLLAGPTAAGKSAVALTLADRLGGEIVSVDSMQVYQGMNIGTAKPSAAERTRVPHHLLDVVPCEQPFDVARFLQLAEPAVAAIRLRGRTPILCGGTGLYFKAWLEGLGNGPPSDSDLRQELESTPIPDLLRELETHDPATFARIDRSNPRRVVRAVEILRLTGRPPSEVRAPWRRPQDSPGGPIVFGLRRAAADLQVRQELRVDQMFAEGLVDETRRLLDLGLRRNPVACQAIGYRQVIQHLDGEMDLPATIALVKTKTRQFTKRQLTWFRHQLPMCWIDVRVEDSPETIAEELLTRRSGPPAA